MKIYLDYVFFINFCFDFILLIGIHLILRRSTTKKRIIMASLFGAFTSFIVFLKVDQFLFFLLKILSGIGMLWIAFRFYSVSYLFFNLLYLMILSIILGGSLYFINIEVGYDHVGMLFFQNGKGMNIFLLLLIAIVVLLIYRRVEQQKKKELKTRFMVTLLDQNKSMVLNGFLDTGNELKDPYFKKPICIINPGIIKEKDPYLYIPYETIGESGILKCYKIEQIKIEKIGIISNILVAESPKKINLAGVDFILNKELWEEKDDSIIMD